MSRLYLIEKRFCFGCGTHTTHEDTNSNNSGNYWYCTKCENGKTAKYPEFTYLNHTTSKYEDVIKNWIKKK